jgi:hypothetical protein
VDQHDRAPGASGPGDMEGAIARRNAQVLQIHADSVSH